MCKGNISCNKNVGCSNCKPLIDWSKPIIARYFDDGMPREAKLLDGDYTDQTSQGSGKLVRIVTRNGSHAVLLFSPDGQTVWSRLGHNTQFGRFAIENVPPPKKKRTVALFKSLGGSVVVCYTDDGVPNGWVQISSAHTFEYEE